MKGHFLSPRILLGLAMAAPATIAVLPHATLAQATAALNGSGGIDATAASAVPGAAISPGVAANYGRLQVTSIRQAATPRAQVLGQSLAPAATPEEWGEASQRDYDANRDDNRDARYDYRPGRRSRGGS